MSQLVLTEVDGMVSLLLTCGGVVATAKKDQEVDVLQVKELIGKKNALVVFFIEPWFR